MSTLPPERDGARFCVAPTSFDPGGDIRAFPRPLSWTWHSLVRSLRTSGCTGVMLRLPLFWQVESAVFRACRSTGCTLYISDRKNMPVAAAAIRERVVDCVVTDAADAGELYTYLAKAGNALPATWHIIHPLTEPARLPEALLASEATIVQEAHVFPSVCLFEQCAYLANKKLPRFHVNDAYQLDTDGTHAFITSTGEDPQPLLKHRLPVPVAPGGTCPCGRAVFTFG